MIVTVLDLPEIPQELFINILIKIPVKSLMRFKCVSKLWLSLITSQYFTNLFIKSSQRSRLFAYFLDIKKQSEYELLTRSNHHHNSDTDVFVIDQDLTMQRLGGGCFVNSVHGLVCFRKETRVRICNLNTRQVLELPMIKVNNHKNVWYYFGHDLVNDQYKVLATFWDQTEQGVVRSEHYMLVLGPKASWKKIQYHIPHRPFHINYSKGLNINSVLYYGALTDANRYVIMSFDFSSQEFDLIELPNVNVDIFGDFSCVDLMNYKGNISVLVNVLSDDTVNVWVLEEDVEKKSQWSDKKTFVLPVYQISLKFFNGNRLRIGATDRSGQVWLTKADLWWKQPARLLVYDLVRNEISQRIEIRPLLGSLRNTQALMCTFWDDIESIMYLEI